MAENEPTPGQALDELHEIMQLTALAVPPQRLTATRYTLCRGVLLGSGLRPSLPGFVLQCLTVARFQDFIHLYHPSAEARVAFIDEAFRECLVRARSRPGLDVLSDPEV